VRIDATRPRQPGSFPAPVRINAAPTQLRAWQRGVACVVLDACSNAPQAYPRALQGLFALPVSSCLTFSVLHCAMIIAADRQLINGRISFAADPRLTSVLYRTA
jgi:hypothetical protein